MNPLISIVMATFNQGQFIKNSIMTVLEQTYTNWELIIVDNYSSDDTIQIIREFDNPKIRYFCFSNQGVVARSRNFGANKAYGKYLAFLDSDDLWNPTKLACFVKNPAPLWGHSMTKIDASNNLLTDCDGKSLCAKCENKSWRSMLMDGNSLPLSSMIVDRVLFRDVGGFSESIAFKTVEDFELVFKICGKYSVSTKCGPVLGYYRVHKANLSRQSMRFRSLACVYIKFSGHSVRNFSIKYALISLATSLTYFMIYIKIIIRSNLNGVKL